MEVLLFTNDPQADSDRILREKAAPVGDINGEIRSIAAEMLELMHAQKGVGLAGPQVGIARRIFVTHPAGDEPRVFINPAITKTSYKQIKYEEGCLSLPGIWADITRPSLIMVQAWNEKGRAFTVEASEMLARVILHENDHLEGMLFLDRLDEAKRARILSRLGKQHKKGRA